MWTEGGVRAHQRSVPPGQVGIGDREVGRGCAWQLHHRTRSCGLLKSVRHIRPIAASHYWWARAGAAAPSTFVSIVRGDVDAAAALVRHSRTHSGCHWPRPL